MKTYTYGQGLIWQGTVREVTAHIRELQKKHTRIIDLIRAQLH